MFESVRMEKAERPQVIILGVFKEKDAAGDLAQISPLYGRPVVVDALARREWTGEAGSIVEAFPRGGEENQGPRRILLVGLGRKDKLNVEKMREIAAKAGRRLAQIKEPTTGVELAGVLRAVGADDAQIKMYGRCWGESLGLLAWKARSMRGSAGKKQTAQTANDTGSADAADAAGAAGSASASEEGAAARSEETDTDAPLALTVRANDAAFADGLEFGLALAHSVNLARALSQTPPNIATPLYMAEQAQKLAQETGLNCRVIGGAELEHERLTGLINVGKASINPPCLIRLEYRPEQGEGEGKGIGSAAFDPQLSPLHPQPLLLIGKTITYDTGGLTLKINNGMVGMKRDKDGGCAVLGAMHAIATLIKPSFPVVALLAAAENMVSEAAFRPDDVLTYRNGVTVEVTNTDAEGRLVLADALCWACEQENPGAIVDLATLTGGVVTALGSVYAGMFCDDDGLRDLLEGAAQTSGERVWRLPLHQEYRDMMKSPVADIINSNPNRKAHPIQGAAFLTFFVTDSLPWAHIDIAGTHAVDGDSGPFVKGPTGYGVRLLADLAATYGPGE